MSRLTACGMRTSWFRWGPGGPCRLFLFEGLGPWWTRGDCSCRGSCCGLSCSLQVSRGHRGRFGVASSLFEKNIYFVILKTKDLNHILHFFFFLIYLPPFIITKPLEVRFTCDLLFNGLICSFPVWKKGQKKIKGRIILEGIFNLVYLQIQSIS